MDMPYRVLTTALLLALSATATAAGPAERALGHLRANPAAVKAGGNDQFVARYARAEANGAAHVRFDRTYHGLPVIGGDVVTHQRPDGSFAKPSMSLSSAIKVDTRARISADEATLIAGTDFGPDFSNVSRARKVVYALSGDPTLAWEVEFHGNDANGGPKARIYYISATDGRVLDGWSLVHTAKPGSGGGNGNGNGSGGGGGGTTGAAVGVGKTLMYGDVVLNTTGTGSSYTLTDSTRGNGATYDAKNAQYSNAAKKAVLFSDADHSWGNNATSDRATVTADAHYGVAMTWDYFKNVHGRNGIFNDGKGVKSYVHVGNGWVNAAWYLNAMYYGDGGSGYLPLVSLDIAGHEMSHGVTQATSTWPTPAMPAA